MSCLDENTLLALLEGALTPRESADAEAHVDQCEACRRLLSLLAKAQQGDFDTRDQGGSAAAATGSLHTATQDSQAITRLALRPGQMPAAVGLDSADSSILKPGEIVDHFLVKGLIGQGGMGQVYRAWDTKLNRTVALKVVHPRFRSAEVVERFLFEARATARFSHPHIVAIYAVGEHGGRPYVALEHIEGQTLRGLLRQGPISLGVALKIGLAVAEALKEAHRHHILHRDLKPGNIMVPKDGRIRVLDFGLAKHASGPLVDTLAIPHATDPEIRPITDLLDPFTSRGVHQLGTPSYMSPEQWRGEPVTGAADTWALGVILHEMICGTRPYPDLDQDALREAALNVDPVPTPELQRRAPGALARLVMGCLEKDPSLRPSDGEVVRVLHEMRGLMAPPPSIGRRRIAVILLGAVLVPSVLVLVLLGIGDKKQRRDSPQSVTDRGHPAAAPSKRSSTPLPRSDEMPRALRPHPPAAQVPVQAGERPPSRPGRRFKPASHPSGYGTLVVQSHLDGDPMWGHVLLDGAHVGQTPLTQRKVRAGRHHLVVQREGFHSSARTLTIKPGETQRVRFSLRRK